MSEGELSQDEIDALLAGVETGSTLSTEMEEDMGTNRKIVLTTYGHGKVIDKIAVCVFEENYNGIYSKSNSGTYCKMINSLKLNGDAWIKAEKVSENTPLLLSELLPFRNFFDLIPSLDDRALQKVMRECDSQDLTKALKETTDEVKEKVSRNMSKRASAMLKEDMEYMGPVRVKDIEEAQQKIMSIIRHLEDTGEIVIARTGEDELMI